MDVPGKASLSTIVLKTSLYALYVELLKWVTILANLGSNSHQIEKFRLLSLVALALIATLFY